MYSTMTLSPLTGVVFAAILLVAGALLYRQVGHRARRRLLHRRFRRAAKGESKARRYLERHGFQILSEQATLNCTMKVDGDPRDYTLTADFLVKKGSERAVIEAKTGEKAVDPVSRSTRRQLLEYATMYDVDAIYLFDAEKGKLRRVAFRGQEKAPWSPSGLLLWLAGCACGFATALLFLYR